MFLRLTDQQLGVLRDALAEYVCRLNEKSRPLCTGYSAEGIELCCRRLEAENLAIAIGNTPSLSVVEAATPRRPRRYAITRAA